MLYQTKPRLVDAVQWFKHGDDPRVEARTIFEPDADGVRRQFIPDHGYLLDKIIRSSDWIVVDLGRGTIYIMTDDEFFRVHQKVPFEVYPEDRRVVGH